MPWYKLEQFQIFTHLILKQIYVSLSLSGADYLLHGEGGDAEITFQVKYNVYYRTNKTMQI